jgi:hypothetical protein
MYYTGHQNTQSSITIRRAGHADATALHRLAERDSAPELSGEVLVAMVDDRIRAAVSISTGNAIADPFHPTAELVALLSERSTQIRGSRRGLRARLGAALGHRARRSASPQPAGTLRAFE